MWFIRNVSTAGKALGDVQTYAVPVRSTWDDGRDGYAMGQKMFGTCSKHGSLPMVRGICGWPAFFEKCKEKGVAGKKLMAIMGQAVAAMNDFKEFNGESIPFLALVAAMTGWHVPPVDREGQAEFFSQANAEGDLNWDYIAVGRVGQVSAVTYFNAPSPVKMVWADEVEEGDEEVKLKTEGKRKGSGEDRAASAKKQEVVPKPKPKPPPPHPFSFYPDTLKECITVVKEMKKELEKGNIEEKIATAFAVPMMALLGDEYAKAEAKHAKMCLCGRLAAEHEVHVTDCWAGLKSSYPHCGMCKARCREAGVKFEVIRGLTHSKALCGTGGKKFSLDPLLSMLCGWLKDHEYRGLKEDAENAVMKSRK